MIRKLVAIPIACMAFGVFYFDELYKLNELEWVPNVLGPILIVVTLYVWNPATFKKRPDDDGDTAK